MMLRSALLLAALCLLVVGCLRIRPAPNVVAPPPSDPVPTATPGPAVELGLGLAEMAAAATPTAPPLRYTVQAGDTLWRIAQRFGVTPEEIVKASRLADPNNLTVGDTLLIPQKNPSATPSAGTPAATPTAPPQRYVVQPGDTLAAIAARFGVSAAEIARVNRLADPDRLTVGEALVVPSPAARQPTASAAASQPTAAPTPTPAPPRRRYTVQEGDSLWSIAEEHGTSVEALRAANPGLSERLHVGQELVIP